MLETLKSNRASAFLLTIVLSIIFFSALVFVAQETNSQSVSAGVLLKLSIYFPVWLQYFISFVLYLFAVWYANLVVSKHQILGNGNHLIGYFVLILFAIGPNLLFDNLIAVSSLLIIRFFDRCFEIQKSNKPNPLIFDASFLTALLCMIYTPFALLLLLVWVSALYSHGFSLKGWLLSIITIFLTFYLLGGLLYLFNLSYLPSIIDLSFQLNFPSSLVNQCIFYSFLTLIILAAPTTFSVLRFSKVILRNHLNIVFLSIPILTVIYITTNLKIEHLFTFMFFPLSIIFGQYFISLKKKNVSNFGLILLTILVAGFQIYRIL